MKNISSVAKKLYLLIFIFLVGFVSLIFVNHYFDSLLVELDNKTNNYESKIKIGEFIAEDIQKLRAEFLILSTTTSKRARDIMIRRINHIVDKINQSLDVLSNGGTLTRNIYLNIPGTSKSTIKLQYDNPHNTFNIVSISIKPKLKSVKHMVDDMINLLQLQAKAKKDKNFKEYVKLNSHILRYHKILIPFFERIEEDSKRLLYESDIELKTLKSEIAKNKETNIAIKKSIIIFVVIIVIVLGFWIIKNINKDNIKLKKLNDEIRNKETTVKAILDGQNSMVIVSNGKVMKNANYAVIEFFNHYKTIDEFLNNVTCICDFFEPKVPNDSYIVKKDYDGKNWLEYILDHPEKSFKVIMNNGKSNHHFSITGNKKQLNNDNIVILSLTDITQEIKVQQELINLNKNLETIVDNKTEELQILNQELAKKVQIEIQKNRQKEKILQEQSRLAQMGEMISMIAHQWRQPLGAISSSIVAIQSKLSIGKFDLSVEEQREKFLIFLEKKHSNIHEYVQSLSETIDDFRNFFKPDKQKETVCLKEPILKALKIVGASMHNKGITIKFVPNSTLKTPLYTNEVMQVILNILKNSEDNFIEKNIPHPQINISTYEDNNNLIITIQDNGGGIPQNILPNIFDPYFSTKDEKNGTGLGLYMSKIMIEEHHHGQLTVSNKNNGACFKIVFHINV